MNQFIKETRHWIESVVIAYNFCPFARKVFEQDKITYHVVVDSDPEACLTALIKACEHLDEHPQLETSLIIYPELPDDFEPFLDLAAIAEQLLIDQGYEGVYQLATFHPQYCFADSTAEDAANYTNRSPYPMLHLLREDSISLAVEHYSDIDKIPERNIETARELGLSTMQNLLHDCFEKPKTDK